MLLNIFMTKVPYGFVIWLLSYIIARPKKPLLLFKSFTGLTVQEFDDIYNKEITKRYHNMN
jgi:hypothetical protein